MGTIGTITIEDYDGEVTTTTVNLQNISQSGDNYASVTQDLDEIKDSIITVVRGVVRKVTVSKSFPESLDEVTSVEAQRETKWLVTMRDTTQYLDVLHAVPNPGYLKLYSFEIGTANLTYLDEHDEEMDVSQVPGSAFKTSMEANTRSPWNNNPEAGITPTQVVVSIIHAGRNT